MIKLTYPEILASIRENGLPKITGFFYEFEDHGRDDRLQHGMKVIGACAMGQAAINISKKYDIDLPADRLTGLISAYFVDAVESENDESDLTFEQIANAVEKRYADAPWFSDVIRINN